MCSGNGVRCGVFSVGYLGCSGPVVEFELKLKLKLELMMLMMLMLMMLMMLTMLTMLTLLEQVRSSVVIILHVFSCMSFGGESSEFDVLVVS